MIRLRHSKLIFISGLIPLVVGFFLLRFGLTTLLHAIQEAQSFSDVTLPIYHFLQSITGSVEAGSIFTVGLALALGMFKGRFVMMKTAKKNFERILTLPNPAPITKIFAVPFYIMIIGMMIMGQLLRGSGAPADIIGVIYTAVGSGLIQSGVASLRNSFRVPKTAS